MPIGSQTLPGSQMGPEGQMLPRSHYQGQFYSWGQFHSQGQFYSRGKFHSQGQFHSWGQLYSQGKFHSAFQHFNFLHHSNWTQTSLRVIQEASFIERKTLFLETYKVIFDCIVYCNSSGHLLRRYLKISLHSLFCQSVSFQPFVRTPRVLK